MTLHPVEAAFIANFVIPVKRERWGLLLGHARRRRDITSMLCHSLEAQVDAAKVLRIPKPMETDELLVSVLEKGARSSACRVISDGPLDQRDLTIREAVEAESGSSRGTLVCAGSGSVCLWMPEPIAESLLLVESEEERPVLFALIRKVRR